MELYEWLSRSMDTPMNKHVKDLYIKILKHGWKVSACEIYEYGQVSISIYDAWIDPEDRKHWEETGRIEVGGPLIPPSWNRSSSYLLTPTASYNK